MATDDFRQAQMMRGSINAHICGDPNFDESMGAGLDDDSVQQIDGERFREDKAKVDEKMREEAKQTRTRGQTATLTEAFDELAARGEVDIEEYWSRVSHCGIARKKFDEWVDKMIQAGTAYSPAYGRLRRG